MKLREKWEDKHRIFRWGHQNIRYCRKVKVKVGKELLDKYQRRPCQSNEKQFYWLGSGNSLYYRMTKGISEAPLMTQWLRIHVPVYETWV